MRIYLLILTLYYLFFGVKYVFAAAPVISNTPSTISSDTAFSITTTMSGLSSSSTYRLRVALSQAGTSNYFGSTFNGTSWYNGTPSPINYSNFLSITTDNSGSWSGTIQGKVESSDPNFSGTSATYDLKVGRYTEAGTSATWSNIVQIAVSIPSPSPTITPSSSPTPTPAPTPTPSSTTSSFTISNIPSQINSDQSFNVSINLSMPNSQNTDYYLKGAFKKADGTRYLGLTKINNDWVEYGDDNTDQYKITTDASGNWTGNLEVKPDIYDKDYKGEGDYIFKVARLTSGGFADWSNNDATIKINDLNNNPNYSSTPKPTSQSNPTNTSSPTPTKTATKLTPPKSRDKLEYHNASVAAATTSAETPNIEISQINIKNEKQQNPLFWIGIIFIFAGATLIGYIYLRRIRS